MVRFGIIGLGNIGKVHLANFASGEITRGTLTATCSPSAPSCVLPAGVEHFTDVEKMIRSGLVDAVIVAAPHPLHREIGEKVLWAGLHLLMEKPLASTKLDGEKLLAVPRHPGQVFGIMLNLRIHPRFLQIKGVLESGELGALRRFQWTATNWFRSEAYYSLSTWRATWKGEGGGVLINQALHNLDALQWLCGMPTAVRAFCTFGRDHDIEVEDNAVAYFEFGDDAAGVFTTSTGEAPGVNRLEIACTGGLIQMENDRVRVVKNKIDSREYSRMTDNAFGAPETTVDELLDKEDFNSHSGVIQNFIEAVLDGERLIVEADEGLRSVELANAMVYSTWLNETVRLPLDAAAYQAALNRAIAASTYRSRTVRKANVDMKRSYSV